MKAVVAAFNQEKALVGAFSVITNLRMELFQALEKLRGCHGDCQEVHCKFPGYLTHGKVLLVGHMGLYDYRGDTALCIVSCQDCCNYIQEKKWQY